MAEGSNCELCRNYVYNEYFQYFECDVNLDEDEMAKFLNDTFRDCPYFEFDDEYKIVRKQI